MRLLVPLLTYLSTFSLLAQVDSLNQDYGAYPKRGMLSLCLNTERNRTNLSLTLDYVGFKFKNMERMNVLNAINYMGFDIRYSGINVHLFDNHMLIQTTDSTASYLSFGELKNAFHYRLGSMFFQNDWQVSGNCNLQLYTAAYLSVGAAFKREQYIEYTHPNGVLFDGSVLNFYEGFTPFPIRGERNSAFLDLGFGSFFGFNSLFSLKKYAVYVGLRCNLVQINGQFLMQSKTKTDVFDAFQFSVRKKEMLGGFSYGLVLGWMF